jgi:hypothetical protein
MPLMTTAKQFLAAAQKKAFSKKEVLFQDPTLADLHDISQAFQTGNCPEGMQITIKGMIGKEGAEILATALKNAPKNIKIDLRKNYIGDLGFAFFVDAIKKGDYPEGLCLHLPMNAIGDRGLIALYEVLKTKKSVNKLYIDLSQNQTTFKCLTKFNEQIASNVNIELANNDQRISSLLWSRNNIAFKWPSSESAVSAYTPKV